MGASIKLATSVLALAFLAGAVAGGSQAGDEPKNATLGASYTFSAAAGEATASGKGQLDLDGKFKAGFRASSSTGGERRTVVGRVTRFALEYLLPRKKLTMAIEVTRGFAQCPKGSRGTLVLVDDASADSVRIRFARAGCSLFSRSWTSTAPDQRVAVGIDVLLEPSESSSNVSPVAPAGGRRAASGARL